jgi:hypothetical protein
MGGGIPVQARPVILSSASIALAHQWLADARKKLYAPQSARKPPPPEDEDE